MSSAAHLVCTLGCLKASPRVPPVFSHSGTALPGNGSPTRCLPQAWPRLHAPFPFTTRNKPKFGGAGDGLTCDSAINMGVTLKVRREITLKAAKVSKCLGESKTYRAQEGAHTSLTSERSVWLQCQVCRMTGDKATSCFRGSINEDPFKVWAPQAKTKRGAEQQRKGNWQTTKNAARQMLLTTAARFDWMAAVSVHSARCLAKCDQCKVPTLEIEMQKTLTLSTCGVK